MDAHQASLLLLIKKSRDQTSGNVVRVAAALVISGLALSIAVDATGMDLLVVKEVRVRVLMSDSRIFEYTHKEVCSLAITAACIRISVCVCNLEVYVLVVKAACTYVCDKEVCIFVVKEICIRIFMSVI